MVGLSAEILYFYVNRCKTDHLLHFASRMQLLAKPGRWMINCRAQRLFPGKPPTGKRKAAPSKSENMEAQTTLHSSNTTSKVNVINDLSWCEQRPYLCPEPDIIVLCYSTIEAESFTEAKTVIWPDLNQRFPGVPVILVATKCDARFDNTAETELEQLWQIDEDSASSTKSKSYFFTLFC